jgi:hypothetical protein
MSNNTPWDDIKTPTNDLNIRQIKGTKDVPLCWGKDSSGNCIFVIELEGNHQEFYIKNKVSAHGINTDLQLLEPSKKQGLVITLENHVDRDLFASLCNTLVDSISDVSDSAVALSLAMSQIKRWKMFLAGRRARILSFEEIRGLFSELKFFQNLLCEGFSEHDALEAWQGPESSHQDFIFSNTAVEIKSLSGKERNSVKISSEDQLESLNDNLFLKIFRLVEMPESERAASLNELVGEIEEDLQNAAALEEFFEKLAKVGYVKLEEYNTPKLLVAEEKSYQVVEPFPRLIRSELPIGILKVGYEIKLENIESFECDNQKVWGK